MATGDARKRALVDAYFHGWNAHDAGAVARTFEPGGTYEDPTTGGPVPGASIARVVEPLCVAFPGLVFERSGVLVDGDRLVVEWTLRGHNRGALQAGIQPTGQAMALRGVDVFEVGEGGLRAVRGYFDQKGFFESFGLMVLVQPVEQGAAKYGYSMRVPSGNRRPPGVIALTWIQGANEAEKERIRAHSRDNVKDFLAEPGFLSIVTGFTGLRGFTVTAWEDEAAMKRALAKHHAVAMKELFSGHFVASVWTSVWTPTRMNRIWVRCGSCGSLEDVNDDHGSCHQCQAPLPERPAFW
ncbi:MAG: nuclear transport factor 2 family protein [Polyangiaceae bacterium]|jgi:predicted ester cyclase|nr:nuclear transport factor 2 family protein [Polyangiaceae bacterium]